MEFVQTSCLGEHRSYNVFIVMERKVAVPLGPCSTNVRHHVQSNGLFHEGRRGPRESLLRIPCTHHVAPRNLYMAFIDKMFRWKHRWLSRAFSVLERQAASLLWEVMKEALALQTNTRGYHIGYRLGIRRSTRWLSTIYAGPIQTSCLRWKTVTSQWSLYVFQNQQCKSEKSRK